MHVQRNYRYFDFRDLFSKKSYNEFQTEMWGEEEGRGEKEEKEEEKEEKKEEKKKGSVLI